MVCSGQGNCPECNGKGFISRGLYPGFSWVQEYPCPTCQRRKILDQAPPKTGEERVWDEALSSLDAYRVCGMEGADIFYIPAFLNKDRSDALMSALMDQMGEMFPSEGARDHRKTLWFGEKPYTYSGFTHQPHSIEGPLKQIFDEILHRFTISFNGVLVNLYKDGRVRISPHSDSEDDIIPHSPILSLSLGATRTFKMRKKDVDSIWEKTWLLGAGDVFIMSGTTQEYWLHQVPRESDVREPRLNLTFRMMR